MPVMDEFREEREEMLKNATPKEKFEYFKEYYKWHVIAAVAILIIAGTWIHDAVTRKPSGFYAAFVNCPSVNGTDELMADFLSYADIDTGEYDTTLDDSMVIQKDMLDEMSVNTVQKLMAILSNQDVDIFCADPYYFETYANDRLFYDLREILPEKELNKLSGNLYYVDGKTLDALDEEAPSMDDSQVPIPDPSKPEEMEDPIPVGIFITEDTILPDYFLFKEEGCAIGIPQNTKNLDNAIKFLEYIQK